MRDDGWWARRRAAKKARRRALLPLIDDGGDVRPLAKRVRQNAEHVNGAAVAGYREQYLAHLRKNDILSNDTLREQIADRAASRYVCNCGQEPCSYRK